MAVQDLDKTNPSKDVTQSPAVEDEESVSGTTPLPTSDDDVGEMVEDFTGKEPQLDELPTDMVNEAERRRRIGEDEDVPPREPGIERLEDLE